MSEQRPKQTRATQSAPGINLRMGGGTRGMFIEPEKSKNTRGTIFRLWRYIQRQRWVLIGTTILVIVTTFIGLLGPFLMGKALDLYISKGDLPGLARLLSLMVLTYIFGAA